jgi:hypothetical protein
MKNALPKTLRLLALIGLGWLTALTCTAEAVPSTPSEPTVLEAYVNNTARTSDVASKIPALVRAIMPGR